MERIIAYHGGQSIRLCPSAGLSVHPPDAGQRRPNAGADIAWVGTVYQTDPPQQVIVANVPLTVTGLASDLVPMQDPPDRVPVQVQATRDRVEALYAKSIRADAALAGLPGG